MDANKISEVAGTVVPYIGGVATAYGAAVLDKVRDDTADATADATVSLGRRLIRRLLRREESRPMIEATVTDLAANPDDEDYQAALRAQIRKALAADPTLADDLHTMLAHGGAPISITASGERSVAAQTIYGSVHTGNTPEPFA
jgi:hypothetical protein